MSDSGLSASDVVAYLERTRWFSGKGRPFDVTAVRRVGDVPGRADDGPRVVLHLVDLAYTDAIGGTETYQVPLVFYTDPETRLDHAFVGWWEDSPETGWVHAYDALHDREAMACWLRSFVAAADLPDGAVDPATGLRFVRVPGHDLDATAHSALFSGEQSNSSVSFGEDSMLKVFRKVTAGPNPDVVVHDALTRAGSHQVAALYGWVEHADPDTGEVTHLAMLQEYLSTASDGWDLALSSVRDLFAEADLHAHEVGGDFAGEATRLGEALREVHDLLVGALPHPAEAPAPETIAAGMRDRLTEALGVVPELAAHAETLRAAYDRLGALPSLDVQPIHGDLHLGQTLRTASGWRIVDFEGEPAKTLAERQLPDSRWRDVAGMLRSFDYAPRVVEKDQSEHDPDGATQRAYRAEEWAHRNRNHFLTAYAGGALSETEHTLLDAYTADKAVYETVYETRNRPTWVGIPLAAIARIGAPS